MSNKFNIDDGFRADLVDGATFEGTFEFPVYEKPKEIIIPEKLIPFTQIKRTDDYKEFVMFYEHDVKFADVLNATDNYMNEFSKFKGIISPDCSLYRDMPLSLQIANTYLNRAVGTNIQRKGNNVIPNVRWGDERSYSTILFREKFAFVGVPKNSIVAIGTYGCIKSKEDKYYFKEGLRAMLEELKPEVVLVYGAMPDSIFSEFKNQTHFVHYDDWISSKRGGHNG